MKTIRIRPAVAFPADRAWLFRFMAYLVLGGIFIYGFLFLSGCTQEGGKASASKDTPLAAGAESSEGDTGDRTNEKLLPDQRTLIGSPPMTVDLAGVFDDPGLNIATPGVPLQIEVTDVDKEKEKVAKAELVDKDKLILTWGEPGHRTVMLRVTNPQTKRFLDTKFQAVVWKPEAMAVIMAVVGGLGIFLLGMKNMSEGLQAIAGDGLRRMISLVTDNRLMGIGIGVLVTSIIQSSSITTVMVVGFVNSGFMTLTQAVGVIMGANIGTTVTAWILVLNIGKYGLLMAGGAAFVYLFAKGERLRYIGMAVMGLGMIFLGLELMKDGFSVFKDLPAFEAWFNRFTAENYMGILKCVLVGTIVTCIVQSSSATTGITIGLAVTGVLRFDTAVALVLGQNIGTTITAFLASIGTTTNAKRAAYFHIIFNITGVVIAVILFPWFFPAMEWLSGMHSEADTAHIARAIAITHSCFNISTTVLFMPLATLCAQFLQRVIPDRGVREKPHLTSLDIRVLETPFIGIEQSRVEILRMSTGCRKMMAWVDEIKKSDPPNEQLIQKVFHREEVLDTIQDEIITYLSNLLSGNIPHSIMEDSRHQLRIADEYESVSDYIASILKSHLKLEKAGLRFPEESAAKLDEVHQLVAHYLNLIAEAYERRQVDIITKAHSQGEAITRRIKEIRDEFLTLMCNERIDPMVSVAYNAQLNAYRRVRDHLLNIAEAWAGEK